MSMMKPDANQTTSMGMMEIIGARTGRLRESNALSVSVPSTRCGSISPAYRLNKKTLAVVVVGLTRRKSGRPHQGRGGIPRAHRDRGRHGSPWRRNAFANRAKHLTGQIEAALQLSAASFEEATAAGL
jgi:hypothetical protein